jgi:hypothetical protein
MCHRGGVGDVLRIGFAFALAFAAVLAAPVVHAQGVARVEITEYGVYTVDTDSAQRNSVGVLSNTLSNIRHAETTSMVRAEHGVHFGFRYRIIGSPAGQAVKLRKVVVFPPEGLKSPKSPTPLQTFERTLPLEIGETFYTDYTLDEPWELVPGPWKIQLWLGDRKLAEEDFVVVAK